MSSEFSSGLFELSFDPKQFSLLSNSLQTADNLNFSDFDPLKKDPLPTLDLSSILYLKEKISNLEKKLDSQNNTITELASANRILREKAVYSNESEPAQTSSEEKDNINENTPNSLKPYGPPNLLVNKNEDRSKQKSTFSQLRSADKKPQPSRSNLKTKLSNSFTNFPSIESESLNLSCNSNKENLCHPNDSIKKNKISHSKIQDGRVTFSKTNNSIRKSKICLTTQPLHNLSYSQNDESLELSKDSSHNNNSFQKIKIQTNYPLPSSNLSYSQNEESFDAAKEETHNSLNNHKPHFFKSSQPQPSSNVSYSQIEESFELEKSEKTLFSRIKADTLQKLRKRISYPRKHEYIEIGPKERESIMKQKRESSLKNKKNNKSDDLEDWFKSTQTSGDIQLNKAIIKNLAEKVLEPCVYRQKMGLVEEFGRIGEEIDKNGKIWACFGEELERERKKNEELSRIVEDQQIMIKEYEKLTKQSNFIRQQCHEMNFGLSDVIRKLIVINNDSKKIIDFCQNNEKERNYLSFSQQMEVILEEMKFYWTKWSQMHETFKLSQTNIFNLEEEEEQHKSPKENYKRGGNKGEEIGKNIEEDNKLESQRKEYNDNNRYKMTDNDEKKVCAIENFEGVEIAHIFDNLKKLHRQSKLKIHKKYQN